MRNIRRTVTTLGLIGVIALSVVGCQLFPITDPIVGGWQLASINGSAPILVSDVQFTASSYTGSTGGVETHTGSWTRSEAPTPLPGRSSVLLGSGSFTPTFSNSNNTLTYTDESGDTYVYNGV